MTTKDLRLSDLPPADDRDEDDRDEVAINERAGIRARPKKPKKPPTNGHTEEPEARPPVDGKHDDALQTELEKRSQVTRKLPPLGWRGDPEDCQLGVAGWVPSHDPAVVQDHVQRTWGGGQYLLEAFLGNKKIAERMLPIPGEPLPINEDDEPAPARGGWRPPQPPQQWPDYQRYPQTGYPPPLPPTFPPGTGYPYPQPYPQVPGVVQMPGGGTWVAPGMRDDPSEVAKLKAELAALKDQKREQTLKAELAALLEARLPKTPAVDPMQTFLSVMQAQAQADRDRAREEARERREALDREETRRAAERKEEREREETRRREEREAQDRRDQAERDRRDREDQRRAEERKDELARLDRQEKAQREFFDRVLATKKDEGSFGKQMRDAIGAVKELSSLAPGAKKDGDDDKEGVPEKIVGVVADAMALGRTLVEDRAEEKKAEREEKKGATGGDRVDGGKLKAETPTAPESKQIEERKKAEVSDEVKYGTVAQLLAPLVKAYKAGAPPSVGAEEMHKVASELHRGGNPIVGDVLDQTFVGEIAKANGLQLQAGIAIFKEKIAHEGLRTMLSDAHQIVGTGDGLAWIKAAIEALKGRKAK